jgi:hypothetical protein
MVRGTLIAGLMGITVGLLAASAQEKGGADLGSLLSSEDTRTATVSRIQAGGSRYLPQLLSLSRNPPPQLDSDELNVGLADAFGGLRAVEAIPFLVEHIGLRRDRVVDLRPWMKTPRVVEDTFPAVRALILIGPRASKAVIATYSGRMTYDERLATVFVVSQIRGVPEAVPFLRSVAAQGGQEGARAEEALRELAR